MRALLVDGHAMVRQALKFYLEKHDSPTVVSMAANVDEALEQVGLGERPDLIILDYDLPGRQGLASFDVLAAAFPEVPIAFLSGIMTRSEVLRAIEIGAAGVIPKAISADAMIYAIQLIIAGEKYLPSMILPDSGEAGAPLKEDVGPLRDLTSRQREVLDLLSEGLSNRKIAESLGVEEVTIKLHLNKIFKKLGVTNRIQAVRIAMGMHA